MSKKYIVRVEELPNGDQFIKLPDELIESLGWKENDEIIWEDLKDGRFSLTRNSPKIRGN